MDRYGKGDQIEPWVKNIDAFYDASNAKDELPKAY